MSSKSKGRNAVAQHRHKREANARRLPRAAFIAGPAAAAVTLGAVGLGVLGSPQRAAQDLAPAAAGTAPSPDPATLDREVVSRSFSRSQTRAQQKQTLSDIRDIAERQATRKAVAAADTKLWVTEDLNLWTEAGQRARKVGELKAGAKVLVTGRQQGDRSEVVWRGKARWVSSAYLSDTEPLPGIGGACTNGTAVASGVSPNIVKVHQAVCSAFPEIRVYGTLRGGGGDHPRGRAVDIMVSGERGWQVAEFVRAHYAELGVSYVIYAQHIWSVERSGEGWRGMENRGSATANHFDHVHVSSF